MKRITLLKLEIIFYQIIKYGAYLVAILGILETIFYSKEYWLISIYLLSIGGLIMFEGIIYSMKEEIKNEKSIKIDQR